MAEKRDQDTRAYEQTQSSRGRAGDDPTKMSPGEVIDLTEVPNSPEGPRAILRQTSHSMKQNASVGAGYYPEASKSQYRGSNMLNEPPPTLQHQVPSSVMQKMLEADYYQPAPTNYLEEYNEPNLPNAPPAAFQHQAPTLKRGPCISAGRRQSYSTNQSRAFNEPNAAASQPQGRPSRVSLPSVRRANTQAGNYQPSPMEGLGAATGNIQSSREEHNAPIPRSPPHSSGLVDTGGVNKRREEQDSVNAATFAPARDQPINAADDTMHPQSSTHLDQSDALLERRRLTPDTQAAVSALTSLSQGASLPIVVCVKVHVNSQSEKKEFHIDKAKLLDAKNILDNLTWSPSATNFQIYNFPYDGPNDKDIFPFYQEYINGQDYFTNAVIDEDTKTHIFNWHIVPALWYVGERVGDKKFQQRILNDLINVVNVRRFQLQFEFLRHTAHSVCSRSPSPTAAIKNPLLKCTVECFISKANKHALEVAFVRAPQPAQDLIHTALIKYHKFPSRNKVLLSEADHRVGSD